MPSLVLLNSPWTLETIISAKREKMGSSDSRVKHWSEELHCNLSRTSLDNKTRIRILEIVKQEVAKKYGSTTVRINLDGRWLQDSGSGGNELTVYASSDGSIEHFWTKRTFSSRAYEFGEDAVSVAIGIIEKVFNPSALISSAAKAIGWY